MPIVRFLLIISTATLIAACSALNRTPNPNGTEVTLIVASEMVDCVGVAPQKCLLIKESKEQEEWHYFYSHIAGFEYVPFYEYKLLINKAQRESVAADQSAIEYQLVKVLAKTLKNSSNIPKPIHAKTSWNRAQPK